jgi:hypothetical protein
MPQANELGWFINLLRIMKRHESGRYTYAELRIFEDLLLYFCMGLKRM